MENEVMEELVASLRVALANTFLMYFKVHQFHWNVEGVEFPQYHAFFGEMYDDVYGAVDPLAENIRKLDAYAPRTLEEMWNHKTVTEASEDMVELKDVLTDIKKTNQEVIASLTKAFSLAQKNNKQGLCNFLADRIDTHEKHDWMLRVSLKGTK